MKKLLLFILLALVSLPVSAQYLTEDFESAWSGTPPAPSGWSQTRIRAVFSTTGERDWVQNTWTGSAWSVSSSGTNPSGAYSGTGVAWIDDYNYMGTATPQASSRLESPVVNLSSATSPYLRFWYFNNQGAGITLNLRIMVSSNGGTTWDVLTPIVNGFTVTASTWNRISVAIPSAYHTSNFKFAFELTNRWGTNNPFIDLVVLEEYTPTTITSAATGDWNSASTWVGGVVPTADNNVVIDVGHTVTMPTTTGIIGRCQNLTINGTLNYSTGTSNLLHVFGNIIVNGTLNAFNGTSGRMVYCGGNFTINSGGTANFSAGTTSQSTSAITITTGAAGVVFLNNQSVAFTNNGTLTSGYIQNILHLGQGNFTYNSPVICYRTYGLYLGTVNPNGNLTLGNSPTSLAQNIERANGTFSSNPLWDNTNITSRSNFYYSANWVPITQTTLLTGNEIELISGVRTVSGTLSMNTHNNLQLNYPLTVGTAATGAGLTLTRGIIISDATNLLHLAQNNTSAAGGFAPSTATPPTTHGSYIVGPLKRTFPASGSISRTFPLGVGTSFNGATPNSNVLKLVTLATGTDGASSQSPIVSIVGAPSGTANSPLTTVMGTRAYRVDLDGGPDFPSTATITLPGMNYTFGNSDNLIGLLQDLRVAQSNALTGAWTERSTTSGSGSILDNTNYTRTTATTSPGPIAPLASNGEYFAWATTTINMIYDSSSVTQSNISNVLAGSTNQEIIGIRIFTTGALSPLSVTKFRVNANGTTNVADIANAKIFYTGSSPTFSATTQFGSTFASPTISNFDIVGSQTLVAGANYFWLTYDIVPGATVNNVVDGECTMITVGGIDYTPSPTAVAGSRTIKAPLSGTYTVGSGGDFATLKAAFDEINSLGLGGNVTLNIISDITETTSASLNQWVETGGSGFTLTIKPSAAVMRTISGSIAAALINLNGADRVTIDGSFSGSGKYLRIRNINTSNTTITFVNGAVDNQVKSCILEGASTSTTNGVVLFGTGNNRNNMLLNCDIRDRSDAAGRPYNGVYFAATSDSFNTVMSCNIYDFTNYGIYISAATGTLIDSCNIFMTTASTATLIRGIHIGNTNAAVKTTIAKNKIYDLNGAATAQIGGIYYFGSSGIATNVSIENNSIYLSPTTTGIVDGIDYFGYTANSVDIYYNSIYIGGTLTSGTSISTGIRKRDAATNFRQRNNVVHNARTNSGGTASHYAVYFSNIIVTSFDVNYNDYFTSGTGGVLGYWSTTPQTTLAAWQSASSLDANSLNTDPQYNSPSNLQPLLGSPVLGAGLPITGITTDILNVLRSGSNPSLGAYELGGDFAGPSISYTPLTNTTSLANRTLTPVTITDASGVNGTSGTAPRIYYKKKSDANVFGANNSSFSGWKWTESTGSSPFTFTIDYSIIFGGSVSVGDTVQYFVVAQDLASTPNVGANPSAGFSATSVSSISSAPTTPNFYKIVGAPLSGDYLVSATLFKEKSGKNITFEKRTRLVEKDVLVISAINDKSSNDAQIVDETAANNAAQVENLDGHFTTVKQLVEEEYYVPMLDGKEYTDELYVTYDGAEGLETSYITLTAAINDLNERGVSGPVRFLLTSSSYTTETLPLTINIASSSLPTATNTVTIKPNTGVTASIIGSSPSSQVFMIRNSHIIIDGSNAVSGTTRDLTIENTSTTSPQVIVVGSTGTTPITNVTIKNCIIINGVNTSSAVIVSDAATPGSPGYFTNITVQNNNIQKAYIGSYNNAVVAAGNGSGLNIVGNELTTSGANAIRYVGIYVQGADGATVAGNTLANFESTVSENNRGIWLASGTTNSIVERNIIHSLSYTGTSGYGAHGIAVSSATANSNNRLINNMISNLTGDGWNYTSILADNVLGIYVFGTQSGVKIYHNSISLSGNTLNQTNAISAGIALGTGSSVDIRNNIVVNNLGLLSATGYGSIGIFLQSSATQLEQANYNNYIVTPSGVGVKHIGQIATTGYTTLSSWQTATGQDANSKSVAVTFAGATDLHLSGGSVGDGNLASASVGITTDLDGESRNAYWPYMGADEVTSSPLALKLTLRTLIEGYWGNGGLQDTIQVRLAHPTSFAKSVPVLGMSSATGVDFYLPKGTSATHWIVVNHRNTIETWSASAISFPSGVASYDFTNAATQAYGDNLKLVAGKWCMFGGDIPLPTQDGLIDLTDVIAIINDANAFVSGTSLPTDLNGDDSADLTDIIIAVNNANLFVSKITPEPKSNVSKPVELKKVNLTIE